MSSKNKNRMFVQPNILSQETQTPTQEETVKEAQEETVEQTTTEEIVEEKASPQVTVKEEVPVEVKKPLAKHQPKSGEFSPVFKVELELNNYAEAMDKSKTITPEEGGRWQYSLFTAIRNILNAVSNEEFNKEWSTVLNFFNKNKDGIFNEKFIFRFPEHWIGSASEFTIYRRLVYTIIQTADHKNRKKALADINMSMVVEGLTEDQKQKIFSFYGL